MSMGNYSVPNRQKAPQIANQEHDSYWEYFTPGAAILHVTFIEEIITWTRENDRTSQVLTTYVKEAGTQ